MLTCMTIPTTPPRLPVEKPRCSLAPAHQTLPSPLAFSDPLLSAVRVALEASMCVKGRLWMTPQNLKSYSSLEKNSQGWRRRRRRNTKITPSKSPPRLSLDGSSELEHYSKNAPNRSVAPVLGQPGDCSNACRTYAQRTLRRAGPLTGAPTILKRNWKHPLGNMC